MSEAEVFEYLWREANQKGLKSISVTIGGLCGDYVAVFNKEGACRIAETIALAASQLPDPKQQSCEMYAKAEKLETEAAQLRASAVRILGTEQQPKSFGPDD